MVASHWGSRALNRNLDELASDPRHPQAFPVERAMDVMGRMRVRLRAEDRTLVAYGYGGQRIEIPASSVGFVRTVNAYRLGSLKRGEALLVLDGERRILLRAPGVWETYGEVWRVCRAAGLPSPARDYYWASSRRRAGQRRPPVYRKAPCYHRLRTAPRGYAPRVLVQLALALAVIGCTAFLGVLPAAALPGWTGAVRTLVGIIGVLIGAAAGAWVWATIAHAAACGLRWAIASAEARAAAPARRFFTRREAPGKRASLLTAAMVLGVPALLVFGPGVAIASAMHGVSDSHLVAELRAQGVPARGLLIDVPDVETDSNGNTTTTDVPTLAFKVGGQDRETGDPAIGGRPLPLNAGDPGDTRQPVTVIYLPGSPDTAAAARQLSGSVWHGAPTANEISGSVLTALLPLWLWRTIVRCRRRRWLRNADLLDDIA